MLVEEAKDETTRTLLAIKRIISGAQTTVNTTTSESRMDIDSKVPWVHY